MEYFNLDPCEPNPCGAGAHCENDQGNALCSCPKGKSGDPLVRCSKFHSTTLGTSLNHVDS